MAEAQKYSALIEEYERKIEDYKKRIDELLKQNAELEKKLEEIKDSSKELEELRLELSVCRRELEKAKKELEKLQSKTENFNKFIEIIRPVMEHDKRYALILYLFDIGPMKKDVLASLLGISKEELEGYLNRRIRRGVIEIEGEEVRLKM